MAIDFDFGDLEEDDFFSKEEEEGDFIPMDAETFYRKYERKYHRMDKINRLFNNENKKIRKK